MQQNVITQKQALKKNLHMKNKQENSQGPDIPLLDVRRLLWGFVVAIPSPTNLKATIKVVELVVSQPSLLLKAAPKLDPTRIGRVMNSSLPLFPQICSTSGPLIITKFPLSLQPVVIGFFGMLPFLTVAGILIPLVCLSIATSKALELHSSNEELDRPVSLPDKSKSSALLYIKTQGGFMPFLMRVGSHVIYNCDLPDLNLRALQVGRITQLCEDSWIKVGFNNKTGP